MNWTIIRSPDYLAAFQLPKVIIPAIERQCAYAVDEAGYFSNDKTTICVTENPRFLAAVLNSAVHWWIIQKIAAGRQNGYFEFKPMYVSTLPIPSASAEEQAELSALVDRILAAKRAGDEATVIWLEAEIDTHVFRLYGLTPEEVAIVKNSDAKVTPAK